MYQYIPAPNLAFVLSKKKYILLQILLLSMLQLYHILQGLWQHTSKCPERIFMMALPGMVFDPVLGQKTLIRGSVQDYKNHKISSVLPIFPFFISYLISFPFCFFEFWGELGQATLPFPSRQFVLVKHMVPSPRLPRDTFTCQVSRQV